MKIILGNPSPVDQGVPVPGPTVTVTEVQDIKNEDGSWVAGYVVGTDAAEVKDHLFDNPGMITHLPGNGVLLNIIRSWADHSQGKPTWVAVDPGERSAEEGEDLERFLSEFWKCDRGIPGDLEDTHYTAYAGSNTIYAPGESPEGE